jgi:hypothetical protein
MATNKFFKSLLFTLTIAISSFGFCIDNSFAYPVFAQQGYSNPRAANGKLACANCHLNQKAIEIEAPQGVLPNSIFEIEIKVPYDTTRQQISADGKPADLNDNLHKLIYHLLHVDLSILVEQIQDMQRNFLYKSQMNL